MLKYLAGVARKLLAPRLIVKQKYQTWLVNRDVESENIKKTPIV